MSFNLVQSWCREVQSVAVTPTVPVQSEVEEAAAALGEAITRAAATHEVAMNDHAVGLASALWDIARAIDNLAAAIREGHADPGKR